MPSDGGAADVFSQDRVTSPKIAEFQRFWTVNVLDARYPERLPSRDPMSDESAPSPETVSTPTAADAPRVRRISNPRPKKKVANVAKVADATGEADPAPEVAKRSKFPEFPPSSDAEDHADDSSLRGDWPEPEAASSGQPTSPENPKRKRRRKKGKGNNAQNAGPQAEPEQAPRLADDSVDAPTSPQQAQPPRPNPSPRPKLDPELLAKFAWKIYLSEVSEEGVALVGDHDAKELTRRCFRLAEIFLEEQARRR